MIAVNVTGTFFITQQVGRHLIGRRRGGAVVTIASTHALVGAPERSTYGIAKAALVQMTRMLAVEWADHDIRVNAIAPGRMRRRRPRAPELAPIRNTWGDAQAHPAAPALHGRGGGGGGRLLGGPRQRRSPGRCSCSTAGSPRRERNQRRPTESNCFFCSSLSCR